MLTTRETEYLESRVLSATPVELVNLLYEGALGSVRDARRHLAGGDPMSRSAAITKGFSFLAELLSSLDHDKGAPVSGNLRDLYLYMQSRLLRAHAEKSDKLLAEVERLLGTLAEGWAGARGNLATAAPPPQPVTPAAVPVAAQGASYADGYSEGGRSWDV